MLKWIVVIKHRQKQGSKIPVWFIQEGWSSSHFLHPCLKVNTHVNPVGSLKTGGQKAPAHTSNVLSVFLKHPPETQTETSVLTQTRVTNIVICELCYREAVLQIIYCTILPSMRI